MNTLTGSRLNTDEYFLEMARLVAQRGTCLRRQVGCVLVDVHNHVLATGYNGVHRGAPHCNEPVFFVSDDRSSIEFAPLIQERYEHACPGARAPSGTALNQCKAIHAEQNALLQCRNTNEIHTVYCTASPCVTCMRMLANTTVQRIVFSEEYPHPESIEIAKMRHISWIHLK